MKSPEEFILPWVKNAEPYSDKHMDIAWENPEIIRMMSNENLLSPSKKYWMRLWRPPNSAIFTQVRDRCCARNLAKKRV